MHLRLLQLESVSDWRSSPLTYPRAQDHKAKAGGGKRRLTGQHWPDQGEEAGYPGKHYSRHAG
eukprot:6486416-Prorocentrum_lima.AAC.1